MPQMHDCETDSYAEKVGHRDDARAAQQEFARGANGPDYAPLLRRLTLEPTLSIGRRGRPPLGSDRLRFATYLSRHRTLGEAYSTCRHLCPRAPVVLARRPR